jgi:hypothetical protein
MALKTIIAAALVVFIVGSFIWLKIRKNSKNGKNGENSKNGKK